VDAGKPFQMRRPSEGLGESERDVLTEQTMEAILDRDNLRQAYRAVRRNKGSAGIDGKDIEATGQHLRRHWPVIEAKLKAGTYQPGAIRGVNIPKVSGGERLLGIPSVQDRIIQQAVSQHLSARVDGSFSDHSYGFRPGRSAHDAVSAAQGYLKEGKSWVVDLDISAFFDHVNHDLLMHRVGLYERDKRVLHLIGNYLRAAIEVDGKREKRCQGTPQGGPLSPLLANIYLDPLDKELESRKLSFCRYADDINIYVSSERSAKRVLESITHWIEKHLRLKVNRVKSGTGRPWERQFLGFTLREDGEISLAERSIERFKAAVRERWDARLSLTRIERVRQWQAYLSGWCNYFGLATERRAVTRLEGWIRRHMRKYFWLRWHNRKGRLNALKRLGVGARHWRVACSRRGAWRIAACPVIHCALGNRTLHRNGLWVPSDVWAA